MKNRFQLKASLTSCAQFTSFIYQSLIYTNLAFLIISASLGTSAWSSPLFDASNLDSQQQEVDSQSLDEDGVSDFETTQSVEPSALLTTPIEETPQALYPFPTVCLKGVGDGPMYSLWVRYILNHDNSLTGIAQQMDLYRRALQSGKDLLETFLTIAIRGTNPNILGPEDFSVANPTPGLVAKVDLGNLGTACTCVVQAGEDYFRSPLVGYDLVAALSMDQRMCSSSQHRTEEIVIVTNKHTSAGNAKNAEEVFARAREMIISGFHQSLTHRVYSRLKAQLPHQFREVYSPYLEATLDQVARASAPLNGAVALDAHQQVVAIVNRAQFSAYERIKPGVVEQRLRAYSVEHTAPFLVACQSSASRTVSEAQLNATRNAFRPHHEDTPFRDFWLVIGRSTGISQAVAVAPHCLRP